MSAQEFDPRILTVDLQFDDQTLTYSGPLALKVQGSKTITTLQNTATVSLGNLTKAHRDYIMSNCNQVLQANYKVRKVTVSAGRKSSGSWQVFQGDIISANLTQPPDIYITLKCATSARDRTQWWTYSNQSNATLEQIAGDFCQIVNLNLNIDPAVDKTKTVPRFTFNGQPTGMIVRIQEMFNVRAYVDDNVFVIKPINASLTNELAIVNSSSGMIGIPEFTEYGIRVRTLADKSIRLGGGMRLTSTMVPVMNADYVITRLDYDLTTRENPFYYDVWANRSG